MITAEKLKTLTTFTAAALTRAINLAGHKGDMFTSAKFLGITNGGEFCYSVTDTDNGRSKVFLKYDPTAGVVSASIG
jgi:hypothetical protein